MKLNNEAVSEVIGAILLISIVASSMGAILFVQQQLNSSQMESSLAMRRMMEDYFESLKNKNDEDSLPPTDDVITDVSIYGSKINPWSSYKTNRAPRILFISPDDKEENIPLKPKVNIIYTDYEKDTVTLNFYYKNSSIIVDNHAQSRWIFDYQIEDNTGNVTWNFNKADCSETIYYWMVELVDHSHIVTGVYSFCTMPSELHI